MGQALTSTCSGHATLGGEDAATVIEHVASAHGSATLGDLSLLTYFAFSANVLCENVVSKVRLGKGWVTLEAHVKTRRAWQRTAALEAPSGALLLTHLGFLKYSSGDTAEALADYALALQIRRKTDTLETAEGALLLTAVGIAKCADNDLEGAEAAYQEALELRQHTGTVESLDGAMLFSCIGLAKWLAEDLGGCVAAYSRARRIREHLGAPASVDGARLLTNLGAAQLEAGDAEEAVETFSQALEIRKLLGELECKDGARLLANLGAAECTRGRNAQALAAFWEAREVLARAGGRGDPDDASLLANIGVAEHALGHFQEACLAYEAAVLLREDPKELTPCSGVRLLLCLASASAQRGNHRAALEAFRKARGLANDAALDAHGAAELLRDVGHACEEEGAHEAALEAREQEREVRAFTGTLDTPEGRALLKAMEGLQAQQETSTTASDAPSNDASAAAFGRCWTPLAEEGANPCPGLCEHWGLCSELEAQALRLMQCGASKKDSGDPAGAMQMFMQAYKIRLSGGTLTTAGGVKLLAHIGLAKSSAGHPEGAMKAHTKVVEILSSCSGLLVGSEFADLMASFVKSEEGCGEPQGEEVQGSVPEECAEFPLFESDVAWDEDCDAPELDLDATVAAHKDLQRLASGEMDAAITELMRLREGQGTKQARRCSRGHLKSQGFPTVGQ